MRVGTDAVPVKRCHTFSLPVIIGLEDQHLVIHVQPVQLLFQVIPGGQQLLHSGGYVHLPAYIRLHLHIPDIVQDTADAVSVFLHVQFCRAWGLFPVQEEDGDDDGGNGRSCAQQGGEPSP